jgi:hypothetical protein
MMAAQKKLNPSASQNADAALFAAHPELGGRKLTNEPKDAALRREWTDYYKKSVKKSSPVSTSPNRVGGSVLPCGKTKPPSKSLSQPKPASVGPKVKCSVLNIEASCQHKEGGKSRIAKAGTTLEVVSTTYGSDKITMKAEMQNPCGVHPQWEISEVGKKNGNMQSFDASGPTTGKLWLISIDPKAYTIACKGCNGPENKIKVRAYPPNKIGVNVDLRKSLEVLRKVLKGAELVLDTIADRFQWKFLEGKIAAEAGWQEFEDIRAFYSYKVALAFDPLFGAEFKISVTPLKVTHIAGKIPGIGKYLKKVIDWLVKAGIYFKMSGGVSCEIKLERKSPEEPVFAKNKGVGIGGKIEPAIGVEAALIGEELVKVELEASGALVATTDPFVRKNGFGFGEFKVTFDGLKGTCRLYFLWGIVDINEQVVLIDAKTLYGPEDIYFHKEE